MEMIGISGSYGDGKFHGWEAVLFDEVLVYAGDVCTAINQCSGVDDFHWVWGNNQLNGDCTDLISDFTVTLAHTGEMGGHCVMKVLPFKNPWGWRKFFKWFHHHHHLALVSSEFLPLGLPSWPVIWVFCLERRDILHWDVLLFDNRNIIPSWCNIFFLPGWVFLCRWHQHPLC